MFYNFANKKKSFFLFLIFSLICTRYLDRSSAADWNEFKGDHFIVCFTEEEKFAKEVSDYAEVYYNRIASELGYPRYSDFWTWEKRVKIYIYPDQASFLKITNQPQWSQGMADYKLKQISSFVRSRGFLESILPHEMAHLIFRDFVGFKGEVPLWLDEGVAQWAEEAKRKQIKILIADLYEKDTLLSIEDMMKLDIRNIKEDEGVYIRSTRTKDNTKAAVVLSGNNLISTFYAQAASLVDFLIEKYGAYSFADFCRQLRDGKALEEALKAAYPASIHSLKEFEDKWRKYLAEGGGL